MPEPALGMSSKEGFWSLMTSWAIPPPTSEKISMRDKKTTLFHMLTLFW
jgi:hypothetical protein